MVRLDDKIALVTGGSEGIGFDTAKSMIDAGAFVFITGRRQEKLDHAVQVLGPSSFAINADSGSVQDIEIMFDVVKKRKKRLDILFVNAGVYEQKPFSEVSEEFYDRCMDINAKGLFFTVQKALPLMDNSGSIILNGSFIGSCGFPGMSVYGATKAAVRSFARTLTAELKGTGPRVNVVSPGPIDTAGNTDTLGNNKEIRQFVTNMVPLARIGQGADIGDAVLFLASPQSKFIAGVELFVDGGLSAV